MIYTIVHTVINTTGEHDEANARVIGVYSNENAAIKQAEEWINATKTSDVNVKRITETEWYFWYDENGKTYGGYVDVYGTELDKEVGMN